MVQKQARHGRWLIIIAVLSFLVFLIAKLPASLIVDRLDEPLPQGVSIKKVSGTVWSGYAELTVNTRQWRGEPQLQWRVMVLSLLAAKLECRLVLMDNGLDITGKLGASLLSNEVRVADVSGEIGAAAINPLAKRLGSIEGGIQLRNVSLSLDRESHRFSDAAGELFWGGGQVTHIERRRPKQYTFPALRASLNNDDEGTVTLSVVDDKRDGLLAELSLNSDDIGGVKVYRRVLPIVGLNFGRGEDGDVLLNRQEPVDVPW